MYSMPKSLKIIILIVSCLTLSACATWKEEMSKLKSKIEQQADTAPTLAEIERGILQALEVSTDRATGQLNITNAFLNNQSIKILMPEQLKKVERTLRKIGKDKYADRFIESMNHAAEKSMQGAAHVFKNAIRKMTLQDARNILNGPDNAATEFFKRHTTADLKKAMLPVIKQATNSVGVTRKYKDMVQRASLLGNFIDKDSLDIDQYVTDKALNGLFSYLANEEKKIRKDPVARTTELLKKVFGYKKVSADSLKTNQEQYVLSMMQ